MTSIEGHSSKFKVFISYSRIDIDFVRKLHGCLEENGLEIWVDWENIPLGTDWWQEIVEGIQGADAFLFVISPDSVSSQVCGQEFQVALDNGKCLAPILIREDESTLDRLSPQLKMAGVTNMRGDAEFDQATPELLQRLACNEEYVKAHTRLLLHALEWDKKERSPSLLLRGSDLQTTEVFLLQAVGKEPPVTDLQKRFVQVSRKEANQRRRFFLTMITVAIVAMLLLATYAMAQWNEANKSFALAQENYANAVKNELERISAQRTAVHNADIARQNEATAIVNEQARATQQAIAEENRKVAEKNERLALEQKNLADAQNALSRASFIQQQPSQLFASSQLGLYSIEKNNIPAAEALLRQNLSLMPIPVAHMSHNSAIKQVQFASDGKSLATCSVDGAARVWNVQSGQMLFDFSQDGKAQDCRYTSDGALFITGGQDGILHVWNAINGQEIRRFKHSSGILSVAVSSAKHYVAYGGEDGSGRVVELSTGSLLSPLVNYAPIWRLDFFPDERRLVSVGPDGVPKVWFARSGGSYALREHGGAVYKIVVSPDGEWLATASEDATSRISEAATGLTTAFLVHDDRVVDVIFSPDSQYVATASDDGTLRIWEVPSGREVLRLHHQGKVKHIAYSPDGRWVASSGEDQAVHIWNISNGQEVVRIPVLSDGGPVVFSPDGKYLVVTNVNGAIGVWDITHQTALISDLQLSDVVADIAVTESPTATLITVADNFQVDLWDLNSIITSEGKMTSQHIFDIKATATDLSVTSDWIAVSSIDGLVYLYDRQNKGMRIFEKADVVTDIDFSQDEKKLIAACNDGSITIWNVESGELVQEMKLSVQVSAISSAHGDRWLMIGLMDQVVIWDLVAQKEILSLTSQSSVVSIRDNNQWLTAAFANGDIVVWDEEILTLASNEKSVLPVHTIHLGSIPQEMAFSEDGKILFVSDQSGQVFFFDLENYQELARFSQPFTIKAVQNFDGGHFLITVSGRNIYFWNMTVMRLVKSEQLISEICSRMVGQLSLDEWAFYFGSEPYRLLCP